MSQDKLLSLLCDGEFKSGQDLAAALGVSRTAIWKQLNKLEDLGMKLESVKGRGYRIPGGLDLLDEQAVLAGMSPAALELMSAFELHRSLDSTNTRALQWIEQGGHSGLVCTAEQQTAGRGRRGRQWVSPYAANLYLSVAWEFNQGAAMLEGLSLAVGVALARALENAGVPPVALKWPNDVLSGNAKLGGVLLEMVGDAAGACQVVVGIGLNVRMPDDPSGTIDQEWTDLKRLAGEQCPQRSVLLALLLNELLPLLAEFETTGFAPWQREWSGLDAFADKPVVLQTGSRQIAGVARGVDERGALQLETASSGVTSIFGGEISLRAQL